jgi:hypothetical protein
MKTNFRRSLFRQSVTNFFIFFIYILVSLYIANNYKDNLDQSIYLFITVGLMFFYFYILNPYLYKKRII